MWAPSIRPSIAGVTCEGEPNALSHGAKPRLVVRMIAQVFPYVASQAQCAGDGCYYDNAAAPKQIILCPSSCTKVSADTTGKIDILLGCATQIRLARSAPGVGRHATALHS
jgi:hypothetical protein